MCIGSYVRRTHISIYNSNFIITQKQKVSRKVKMASYSTFIFSYLLKKNYTDFMC